MLAAQPAAPATLPMHTIKLNNRSCLHKPSSALDPAKRRHHTPLYNAAPPNDTICSMRHTAHITRHTHSKRHQPSAAASSDGRVHSRQQHLRVVLHRSKRTIRSVAASYLPRRCCCCNWPAAAGTAVAWIGRCKSWTSRSCPLEDGTRLCKALGLTLLRFS